MSKNYRPFNGAHLERGFAAANEAVAELVDHVAAFRGRVEHERVQELVASATAAVKMAADSVNRLGLEAAKITGRYQRAVDELQKLLERVHGQ